MPLPTIPPPLLPCYLSPNVSSCLQWCGSSHDSAPLPARLLEFAQEDWRCKAIYQLNFSSYCPPGAFCEQTIQEHPPTTLDSEGGWKSLKYAEVIYTGIQPIYKTALIELPNLSFLVLYQRHSRALVEVRCRGIYLRRPRTICIQIPFPFIESASTSPVSGYLRPPISVLDF